MLRWLSGFVVFLGLVLFLLLRWLLNWGMYRGWVVRRRCVIIVGLRLLFGRVGDVGMVILLSMVLGGCVVCWFSVFWWLLSVGVIVSLRGFICV